jgi:two-component system repressor protein LuxO
MARNPRVLLVEDTPPLARVYTEYLRFEPIDIEHVETGEAAFAAIDREVPDAVLLDLRLPDMDGLEILRWIRQRQLPSSVVIITAHGSVSTAVEAMRDGAYDFLVKPFSQERLIVTLNNALERSKLQRMVDDMASEPRHSAFAGFTGSSLAMQAIYATIRSAAPSSASIFITGESGTGKELCAEAIRQFSDRAEAPFMAINCAAIPRDLLESEIFGHVKGAFTGAVANRDGAATLTDGGTLFLDEICDMAPALQAKLLRFVQTGTFQRVGSSKSERVNVRFICATNRDPLAEVEAGRFRGDLYYRLHVIPIHLPALRERDDDVIDIAEDYLRHCALQENKPFERLDADVRETFRGYGWPGNVRELQNIIRNVVVLNTAEVVTRDMLPPPLDGSLGYLQPANDAAWMFAGGVKPVAGKAKVRPLHEIERDVIEEALRRNDGNVPRAAALLEISPSTVYRKQQNWNATKDAV